jgi:DNA polymerase III subunit epsilon
MEIVAVVLVLAGALMFAFGRKRVKDRVLSASETDGTVTPVSVPAPVESLIRSSEPKPERRPRFHREKRSSGPLVPDQFIVLDLETTGFSPSKDEIIEIGAIRVTRGSDEAEAFHTLVQIQRRIPPLLSEMTGITQKMINSEGTPLGEALNGLIAFIGDLPIVTYGASFDMEFLQSAASRHGLLVNNRYSCALQLARRAWPELDSHKLEDMAEHLKLPTGQQHRAIQDCQRALPIFVEAVVKLGKPIKWSSLLMEAVSTDSVIPPPIAAHGTCPMYEKHIARTGNPGGLLFGEVLVFTGDLSLPRGEAADIASVSGCEVKETVSRHTTLLVVGYRDLSLYSEVKSAKQRSVDELMAMGHHIRILTETEFLALTATVQTK